jgi:hypothetical protein
MADSNSTQKPASKEKGAPVDSKQYDEARAKYREQVEARLQELEDGRKPLQDALDEYMKQHGAERAHLENELGVLRDQDSASAHRA